MWSLFNRRKRSSSNGLKQAAERSRAFEARSLQIDTLEQRSVPAITVTNLTDVVNISKRSGNDAEAAITVNPNDPNQLYASSNLGEDAGLFAGRSLDGGLTWIPSNGGDPIIGDGSDGVPSACCDPTLTWDEFGTLFVGWLGDNPLGNTIITQSVDAGGTLQSLANIASNDQPTIVTGPSSNPGNQAIWAVFNTGGQSQVAGAEITGLGQVGAFTAPVTVPNSGGNFGDIVIGPNGEVMVVWQNNIPTEGPSDIFVSTDPDGFGPQGFSTPVKVTTTNVGGFDFIPAQPNRSVDSETGLVWDRSGGPNNGRVYLVYTDELVDESNDTDIFLRFSDDAGVTWSAATKVNDDTTTNSQFLPKIDIDQSTGNIAIVWHDSRNDAGVQGSGSTNAIANDDSEFFGTASDDGGQTFTPNFQISGGVSNANAANNGVDYGDYIGVTFEDNILHPIWADNSNSTGDNPDGTLGAFDLYTRAVQLQSDTVVTPNAINQILLQPATATNVVGQTHSVIATALDVFGQPVANAQLTFVVTGANGPIVGTGVTDTDGLVQFTYTGTNVGVDTIQAFDGADPSVSTVVSPVVTKTWIAASTISGTVFVDQDRDGFQDATEVGIPNTTILVQGTDVLGNTINITTFTDVNGNYAVGPLGPGAYTVTQIQPNAYFDGTAILGANGGVVVSSNQIINIGIPDNGLSLNLSGYNFTELGLRPEFVTKRFFFATQDGSAVIGGDVDTPADAIPFGSSAVTVGVLSADSESDGTFGRANEGIGSEESSVIPATHQTAGHLAPRGTNSPAPSFNLESITGANSTGRTVTDADGSTSDSPTNLILPHEEIVASNLKVDSGFAGDDTVVEGKDVAADETIVETLPTDPITTIDAVVTEEFELITA